MKIEMGESLFYSWLRHVKECRIVQTNWKVSPQWEFNDIETANRVFDYVDEHFERKGYDIFKQNSSYQQVIRQGECDVLGITIDDGEPYYYAVEVAFHEAGLIYGSREKTVAKVVEKCVRAAMCVYGYMDSKEGEIIFASPKINNAVICDLAPCFDDLNKMFGQMGFDFNFRIIANDEFNNTVLQPILILSEGISDTSELFLRSFKMFTMFGDGETVRKEVKRSGGGGKRVFSVPPERDEDDPYKELKVGQIAKTVLREMLKEGYANAYEIEEMQKPTLDRDNPSYSKRVFGLDFPLLAKVGSDYDRRRYYTDSFYINGEEYVLCSQWFEVNANNDRPFLLDWIKGKLMASDDE